MTPEGLFLVLASPFVGSFLGTVAVRYETGHSWAAGRSECDSCRSPLGAFELVPIASWIGLKGRCGHCDEAISIRYPAVELAALVIGLTSILLLPGTNGILGAVLGWTLLLVALVDIKTFRIPDLCSLSLLAAGLANAGAQGGWTDIVERALAALIGGAVLIVVSISYRKLRGTSGLGGGDVKLVAAAGAWVGLTGLPFVILTATFAALAWVILCSVRQGQAVSFQAKLPFGPFLAIGFWAMWLAQMITLSSI